MNWKSVTILMIVGILTTAPFTTKAGGILLKQALLADTAIDECIRRVIMADDSLGKIRNHAPESIPLSQAITDYVNSLQKITLVTCPLTFIKAFDDHIQAWLHMRSVTDKYPQLRGEMHVLFNKLEKSDDAAQFKMHLDKIWETWTEVEKNMTPHQQQ